MHPLCNLPESDPTQVFRFRDRQYAAELIAVAVLELNLFTWIRDEGSVTVTKTCANFGLAVRPVDVLLTLCRASGFLEMRGDGSVSLTSVAQEYLVADSPWFLGPYYEPYRNSAVYDGYLRVLSTGKPANWGAKREGDDWHESMMKEDFARGFTEIMNCRGRVLGQHLAASTMKYVQGKGRLLDVGGGSGIYALTMLARNIELTGIVLEQPPVDRLAQANIEKFGMSDRLKVVAGNMFTDSWPEADVVLLSNLLHDWGLNEVEALLKKMSESLSPDGVVIIHEAFLHNDKSGPLPVAEYSAMLMHITQGCCYAPYEYEEILHRLGFRVLPFAPTIADRGFLAAVRRGA
jgi:predicted O-methyltransferase YrrM